MIFLMADVFAPSLAALILVGGFWLVVYGGVGAAIVAGVAWCWKRWRARA